MAIKTTYEVFDIINNNENDFSISATDKNNHIQVIISNDNVLRYIKQKYSERKYTLLTSNAPATQDYAKQEFNIDFKMWITNRQHNIDIQYQSLFDFDYSPIENYDRYENETLNSENETTYGKTDTESGTDRTIYGKTDTESGTDRTTYGKTDTESGTDRTTYGKAESNSGTDTFSTSGTDSTVKSGGLITETQKAGFNAPNTYTNDTKTGEEYDDITEATRYGKTESKQHGHTITNSGNDSITYGKTNTESGSDSITYGKTNTESGSDSITYGKTNTESGKDTIENTSIRELHSHGNIGVTTSTDMILGVIEMRKISLAEMLIDNFINDYTYYA